MPLLYFHRVVSNSETRLTQPDVTNCISEADLRLFVAENRERLCDWSNASDATYGRRVSIGMTFDDGYADFVEKALPIIEESGVRVLLFVTSGFPSGRAVPYEYLLGSLVEKHGTLTDIVGAQVSTETESQKFECYRRMHVHMKQLSPRERKATMDYLLHRNGTPASRLQSPQLLSWEEIVKLNHHPLVDIGAHTMNHAFLPSLGYWDAWNEIAGGKRALEEKLERRVHFFAYPYGGHNRAVRMLVRAAGFKYAFTTSGNRHGNYALPRRDGIQWINQAIAG